jgi:cytoskeletal protein RodZ
MVENFGSYLKHERELRGITLEAISGTTKIHIRFLRALENNNFEELPGDVFIKGYIRSYADIIGSDPEETLNVYEEFVGNKVPEKNLDSINQSNISAIKFLGYALIGLIVLALVFSAKLLFSNQKISAEKIFKKDTIQENKNDSEKKEILKEDLFPVKKPVTKELIGLAKEQEISKSQTEVQRKESILSPNKDENLEVLEKPLKLTVKVKSDSWFNMTIDNFREEDFILPAGEEKSFFGEKTFRLTIGNNKDTELILNGKNLVIPYGNKNIVKDFIITAKLIN